jgi:hypothetical protein
VCAATKEAAVSATDNLALEQRFVVGEVRPPHSLFSFNPALGRLAKIRPAGRSLKESATQFEGVMLPQDADLGYGLSCDSGKV